MSTRTRTAKSFDQACAETPEPSDQACAETPEPSDQGCAAAVLLDLPRMSAARLRSMLEVASPGRIVAAVLTGGVLPSEPAGAIREAWERFLGPSFEQRVQSVKERLRNARAGILYYGGDGYPSRLLADQEAPPLLFFRGASPPAVLGDDRPRVALVGTRRPTGYGTDVAFSLGRELAEAGVCVLSGLAHGIDAAAHRGALSGEGSAPVAVVGTGLDVVYPRSTASTWRAVAEQGLIVSEFPLGSGAERWHFPYRNRVIAALADVVVVVESRETGGAMSTVDAALQRGVDVMAVPGSVRSLASTGTNQLLYQGSSMVRDVEDVLVALSLRGFNLHEKAPVHAGTPAATEPPALDALRHRVLDAVRYEPTPTASIMEACSQLGFGEVSLALDEMEAAGLLRRGAGWWERR